MHNEQPRLKHLDLRVDCCCSTQNQCLLKSDTDVVTKTHRHKFPIRADATDVNVSSDVISVLDW